MATPDPSAVALENEKLWYAPAILLRRIGSNPEVVKDKFTLTGSKQQICHISCSTLMTPLMVFSSFLHRKSPTNDYDVYTKEVAEVNALASYLQGFPYRPSFLFAGGNLFQPKTDSLR